MELSPCLSPSMPLWRPWHPPHPHCSPSHLWSHTCLLYMAIQCPNNIPNSFHPKSYEYLTHIVPLHGNSYHPRPISRLEAWVLFDSEHHGAQKKKKRPFPSLLSIPDLHSDTVSLSFFKMCLASVPSRLRPRTCIKALDLAPTSELASFPPASFPSKPLCLPVPYSSFYKLFKLTLLLRNFHWVLLISLKIRLSFPS